MNSVEAALARVWPVVLRTERLVLRPVSAADAAVVRALLINPTVRRYLGGPVAEERIAARQRAYTVMPGALVIAPAGGGPAVGLVTVRPDDRCAGRAEVSYQLLPIAWGQGLGREAVGAVLAWWTAAVPGAGPVIAVTQEANTASRRLLEAVGMVPVDVLVEHGARQCLYVLDGDRGGLPWPRLAAAQLESAERRRVGEALATAEGSRLPSDLSALDVEELARLCPARHGVYGRICARTTGHRPEFHLGKTPDGEWICWLGDAVD